MKSVIIIGLLILSSFVSAQQTEQYTQYMLNQFGSNPAFAGLKECADIRMGYRGQWAGFDGAPKTSFVNLNGRIFQRKTNYKYKHGAGLNAVNDLTGPTSRTTFNLAYAYHVPLTKKTKFSMGIQAGFLQYRFDESRVTLGVNNDIAISGSQSKFLVPDITMGLLIYNKDFYAGLTLKQAWRNKLDGIFQDSRLTHHYYLNIGKRFYGDNDVDFVPSVMLKYTRSSVLALDLNLMVDFNNKIALGVAYRNVDAVAAMVKFNILKRFSLGYAFDFTTSKIRYASSNSHEIMLGIYACPMGGNSSYECPVF